MPEAAAVAAGPGTGAAADDGAIAAATSAASGTSVPPAFQTIIASSTITLPPNHADGVAATAAATGARSWPGATAGPAGPVVSGWAGWLSDASALASKIDSMPGAGAGIGTCCCGGAGAFSGAGGSSRRVGNGFEVARPARGLRCAAGDMPRVGSW